MFLNIILAWLGIAICYFLTLSFLHIKGTLLNSLLSISLITVVVILWKEFMDVPPALYTVFMVLLFGVFIWVVHKSNLIMSLIGSLLTFITVTFGSMLLSCPILMYLGWDVSKIKMSDRLDWIVLNLSEYFIPLIVLIILRWTKFSLDKFLQFIQD